MKPSLLSTEDVAALLSAQKAFFDQGTTRPYVYRSQQLDRLYHAIKKYEKELESALAIDLGKSTFESHVSEISFTLASISRARRQLKRWMKPHRVTTPMTQFPSASRIERIPYGSVLIVGPYNYPVQLLLEPLIGAMAAGNCAVLSPSELTPHVAETVKKLTTETFDPSYICCVDGGVDNNQRLIHSRFDYIFFTGSVPVGKLVMEAASKNLIPVTLELGGKSPLLVDHTVRLRPACERIVWGKLINAGQTCIAPDYALVDHRIYDAFLKELIQTIRRFYGTDIRNNPDYGRIVNQRHLERLQRILVQDRAFIRYGGSVVPEERYIEPTILCPDDFHAACMQEELFGPLLPVFSYRTVDQALELMGRMETPLALYLFSEDQKWIDHVLQNTASGGVCINDVISHIANHNLPFGGKGHSGMGSYHGKDSYLTFSHQRSVLKKSTLLRHPLIFPPYTDTKLKLIRRLLK